MLGAAAAGAVAFRFSCALLCGWQPLDSNRRWHDGMAAVGAAAACCRSPCGPMWHTTACSAAFFSLTATCVSVPYHAGHPDRHVRLRGRGQGSWWMQADVCASSQAGEEVPGRAWWPATPSRRCPSLSIPALVCNAFSMPSSCRPAGSARMGPCSHPVPG